MEDIYPCRVPGTGTTEFRNHYFTRVTTGAALQVSILQTDGFVGRSVALEILPGDGLARACLRHVTDQIDGTCVPHPDPATECAVTGHVTTSRPLVANEADVSDVTVAGELAFADGLEMTFLVPLGD